MKYVWIIEYYTTGRDIAVFETKREADSYANHVREKGHRVSVRKYVPAKVKP